MNKSDGEIAEFFTCTNPACQHNWKKINLKRCGFVPVVSNYSYVGIQQTKRGIEPVNRRTERKVSTKKISRVKEISSKPCPYWLPDHPMDKQGPQYRRNALRARNIHDARDFYTTRNLWALALLWHHAGQHESPRVSSQARFCVTAISLPMTRMYRYRHDGKGGILTGSLYIPSLTQEMNVGTAFWAKVPDAVAVAARRTRFDAAVLLRRGSATMLNLPDSSVDYVFTDPPFGSNIYYSEASCSGQGKTDTPLSNFGEPLEVIGTDLPERRVQPRAVVKHLDVIDHSIPRFLTRGIGTQSRARALSAPQEPFHDRLIQAITCAAHTTAHAMRRE